MGIDNNIVLLCSRTSEQQNHWRPPACLHIQQTHIWGWRTMGENQRLPLWFAINLECSNVLISMCGFIPLFHFFHLNSWGLLHWHQLIIHHHHHWLSTLTPSSSSSFPQFREENVTLIRHAREPSLADQKLKIEGGVLHVNCKLLMVYMAEDRLITHCC